MWRCYRCDSPLADDPLEQLVLRDGTVAQLTETDARCCPSCWQSILERIRAREAARTVASSAETEPDVPEF
jgi:hypothetical protein